MPEARRTGQPREREEVGSPTCISAGTATVTLDWSVDPELSRADLRVSMVRPPLTPHLIHAGRVTNHMRSTPSAYSWGLKWTGCRVSMVMAMSASAVSRPQALCR